MFDSVRRGHPLIAAYNCTTLSTLLTIVQPRQYQQQPTPPGELRHKKKVSDWGGQGGGHSDGPVRQVHWLRIAAFGKWKYIFWFMHEFGVPIEINMMNKFLYWLNDMKYVRPYKYKSICHTPPCREKDRMIDIIPSWVLSWKRLPERCWKGLITKFSKFSMKAAASSV